MVIEIIAIGGAALFAYALVSAWFERTVAPPPFAFMAIGLGIWALAGPEDLRLASNAIHALAAVTLALVLFTDATRFDLSLSRRSGVPSARLLLIVMPVTIVVTAAAAAAVTDLPLVEAALLAALLAPTDAALVDPIIHDERVPRSLRQALNAEAGLNDGLAAPVIIALAASASFEVGNLNAGAGALAGLQSVLLGAGIGLALGWVIGRTARSAHERRIAEDHWIAIGLVGAAIATFGIAEVAGGNEYIAVFAAGAMVGSVAHELCGRVLRFAERQGQLLAAGVFLVLGAQLLPDALETIGIGAVLVGLVLFLVARPLAVLVAFAGTGMPRRSRLFLGWFGPRGLATVAFAMLLFERGSELPDVVSIAFVVVAMSVVLHGITTRFGPDIIGDVAPEPVQVDAPMRQLTRRGEHM